MSAPQPNNTGMSRAALFFPDDVIIQILSLLDVKSLMQLKCVCKSWNLLIYDPIFIKRHLKRSARNPHIAIMNSLRPWSITTLPIRSLFENTSITLSENPNPFYNNMGHLYLVGSCNGLLCFVSYFNTSREWMDWTATEVLLYLWNPATRRISNKIVFLPHEYEKSDEYQLRNWYFAFGYDNSTNTYKIVAVCGNKVRIFNVGEEEYSNVWRNIQSFPLLTISSYSRFIIDQLNPPSDYDKALNRKPILAVLMDSLCFSDYFNGTIIIWQMKEYGVEDSWTRILKFSYQNLPIGDQLLFPLSLSKNDDILILILSLPWYHDEPAFLYNFRDNRVEHKTRITNPRMWYFAKGYVESLVSTS